MRHCAVLIPRKSTPARGLTLLEVLAATVILSLLTMACVPLISRAAALLGENMAVRRDISEAELGALADEFVADPSRFIDSANDLHQIASIDFAPTSAQLPWLSDVKKSDEMIVRVHASPRSSLDAKHAWLVFTWGDAQIIRWVPLPDRDEEESGGAQ